MKKEQLKRLYGILLSVMLIVAGICLAVQCVSIYRSGDRPFSREAVAAHFAPIALPVLSCAGLALLAPVASLALPSSPQRLSPAKQYPLILEKLREKRDWDTADEALRTAIAAQQRKRRTLSGIRTLLIVLCSVIFLCYGCNSGNFDSMEINSSMVKAMYVLLPCCAVPFLWSVYAAYQTAASYRAEIDLWKQLPLAVQAAEHNAAAVSSAPWLRNVLLIAAVGLLLFGFATGGTNDVLTKAINICTECVGLG